MVGEDYTFLGEYVNNRTELQVIHNVCGHVYLIAPKPFLRGNRCPECNPYRLRTTEEVKAEIYDLVGDEYNVVSEYIGHHDPLYFKHNTCGIVYKGTRSDFLKDSRCRQCYLDSRKKTNEEWLIQVRELSGDDYEFLEPYQGDDIKLRYRHNCGEEHKVTPNNFINGTRCPYCSESNGEVYIRRYLNETGIAFESQKSFDGLVYRHPLKYDFYLMEERILIEFQGIQHYEPVEYFGGEEVFKYQVIRDNLKRDYAKNNGLELIEIPYTYNSYAKIKQFLDTTISKNHNAT